MPRRNRFFRYVLKNRSNPSQNRRRVGQSLILLSVFLFFVFLINFAIIVGTGTKFGHDLVQGAKNVHQVEITKQATRGTIFDRTGKPIAQDSTTYTIFGIIDTSYVSAKKEPLYIQASQFDKVADILNKKLGIEKNDALKELNRKGQFQVYFGTKGKNIPYGTMKEIETEMEAAGVKGVNFDTSPGRTYPNGNFASLFIGLAQLENNKDGSQSLNGQTGMEGALDKILSGQDGKIIYQKDSKGRIVPGTETVEKETIDGQDVYTTLSEELQRSLETNMDVFAGKTGSKNINATLYSAKTGEILATTQRPSFDADTKEGLNSKDFIWRSLLYQENFEPGSTMKVMTLASAIDNGTFNANGTYANNGYTIADRTINDWTVNEGQDPVTLTYAQGFALSSNVGMTRLQQTMGDEKWLNYLTKFRFGYPTRFGMDAEEAGMLPADNIVSIAMSSFGQGINVTQTQMLRSFSAIANDGVMLEPKFITALYDPNANTARISKPEVVGKPVSQEAAKQTRDLMVTVGTDPFVGTMYAKGIGAPVITVDGYNIAVKSGTAEIARSAEEGGGYLDGELNNLLSVVAMVPAENPEFIMYVTVKQPEHWSILFWQDIFNPVLKEAMLLKDSLNLNGIAPSLSAIEGETAYKLPDLTGRSPGATADDLRRNLVQPIVLGNGDKITKVSAEKDSNLASNQQILLLTNNFTEVPDMYGWTKENLEQFAKWTKLDISYKGEGSKAVAQSVRLGTELKKTKKITITLGE